MIATQSHPLRVSLRAVPGVPIVHVNRAVMVLEPASDATLRAKHRVRYAIISLTTFVYLYDATYRLSRMHSHRLLQKGPY